MQPPPWNPYITQPPPWNPYIAPAPIPIPIIVPEFTDQPMQQPPPWVPDASMLPPTKPVPGGGKDPVWDAELGATAPIVGSPNMTGEPQAESIEVDIVEVPLLGDRPPPEEDDEIGVRHATDQPMPQTEPDTPVVPPPPFDPYPDIDPLDPYPSMQQPVSSWLPPLDDGGTDLLTQPDPGNGVMPIDNVENALPYELRNSSNNGEPQAESIEIDIVEVPPLWIPPDKGPGGDKGPDGGTDLLTQLPPPIISPNDEFGFGYN